MRLKTLLFPVLVTIFLTACGGGGTSQNATAVSKAVASQACMSQSCHGTMVSPGTGALIVEEWTASIHNTKNGAGCADCHEPDAGHPNLCNKCHGGGGFGVVKNPDQAGKCGKCHGLSFPNDAQMALAPQHFGYSSARVLPQTPRASYVSGQYIGNCRACHNPHNNTLTDNHREYAKSLHGDPRGVAWSSRDFKQSAACIRCHTTTGYISFVSSGFSVPTQGFGAGDTSREVLGCNGCHTSYDFKNSIRKVQPYTASYNNFNGTALASFPDVGESNLCIPCHSGRNSGQSINAITSFSNVSFVNPHYLAAAGLMYMQIGFTNFTSADAAIGSSTYGKSLSPDNISTPGGKVGGTTSTHRKFGTPFINGDSHKPSFFVPGVFDQNGPCVTCHLNASGVSKRFGSGHSLKIDANAYNQVCINCHTAENAVALNANNFRSVFLEPQAEAMATSLELIKQLLLTRYGISFEESASPYFFDERLPMVSGKKQPVKDWTRGGAVDGRKLMGACFNLNLLTRDPAAYAHARSYSRRLVYDSIDFLDDGAMNLSVSTTAVNSGLTLANGAPAFGKDVQAYNVAGGSVTTIYGTTSEAMLYLIGWSRSNGQWAAIERP
jgi:formate-dependent nitrite reductase cytochrome c552 subunit